MYLSSLSFSFSGIDFLLVLISVFFLAKISFNDSFVRKAFILHNIESFYK